jgi:hypothetical protein
LEQHCDNGATIQSATEGALQLRARFTDSIAARRFEEALILINNTTTDRFDLLADILSHVEDPSHRVALFEMVWTSARVMPPTTILMRLIRAMPELRELVPATWPDDLIVYRGVAAPTQHDARRYLRRPSWTLDRALAEKFARGLATDRFLPFVGTAIVRREALLAYVTERGEAEVLLDSRRLRIVSCEPLAARNEPSPRDWHSLPIDLQDRGPTGRSPQGLAETA